MADRGSRSPVGSSGSNNRHSRSEARNGRKHASLHLSIDLRTRRSSDFSSLEDERSNASKNTFGAFPSMPAVFPSESKNRSLLRVLALPGHRSKMLFYLLAALFRQAPQRIPVRVGSIDQLRASKLRGAFDPVVVLC